LRISADEHRRGITASQSQGLRPILNIAEGSLAEVEYLFLLSRDLGYLDGNVAAKHIAEATDISKMVFALRRKVEGENGDLRNS